jgi:GH15 family glucan-1,4-alpha-glucosidase
MSRSWIAAVLFIAFGSQNAEAQTRTWYFMPTGNGHGFQVFDRQQNRITYFLEHPYRYVAPGADDRTWGIGRRDLTHDIYFGARINGTSKWINACGNSECADFTSVEYEAQTNIIHGVTNVNGATIDAYFFAPYGYEGNGMVMLMKVTNGGGSPMTASIYAKPNMLLGNGRVDPDEANESIQWNTGAAPYGVETGPGGGHVLYVPIGEVAHASCGSDATIYNAMLSSGNIGDNGSCNGTGQVLALQHDTTIDPGSSAWFGEAVLFLNDNPNDARASLFKDNRSINDILALWQSFQNGKTAEALHTDALAEWEAWRKPNAPSQLNADELKLWRQSEAVLRMGQIREKPRQNDGMVIAALPIGEWHTGWVRDATYAITAYSMTGHTEEARRAVEFFIGAEGGYFNSGNYLGYQYRVSVCRYFGNGIEEGDFNQDGPNIETDGWGLILWAARYYLHYSCDLAWLDTQTWRGDTVYEALHKIAQDIETYQAGGLPGADASIWEVHWDRRQVFSYTVATQIRGLFDFADIAAARGDMERADHFRQVAQGWLDTAKSALVHSPTNSFASHLGVAGNDVHVDGSNMGFLDFGLIGPDDPLWIGTLNSFSRIITGFGGYRRLEPMLSLTGEGSANTYDLSEWILLDLRISDAWRTLGYSSGNSSYTGRAEELLNKVSTHAVPNDYLVPELYDKDNGRYTGVVPMVGYGAGAWMMSQLRKYGSLDPAFNAGFAHCTDPCFNNPCTETNKTACVANGSSFTCNCDAGFHDDAGSCVMDTTCSDNTCNGHGQCDDTNGIACTCETGYLGTFCTDCAQGFKLEGGACVMIQVGPPPGEQPGGRVFNDGRASLCRAVAPGSGFDHLLILFSLVAFAGWRKRRGN